MESDPEVSAIIIFYNAQRFIREAIESVLAQTYKNWELILADDGSTDSSRDIAQDYAEMFPHRIHYVEHEGHKNRGMSATRNLAARDSRGKWLAFLDSDDVWHETKLEDQLRLLTEHSTAGLLYGSPLYWYSWSQDLSHLDDYQPGVGASAGSLVEPPELLLKNYPLGKAPAPCPSDLIVAKRVFASVGGFEESFEGIYQMYEDQAFLTKVYRTTPVFISDSCWTKYRQHPDACSAVVLKAGQYKKVRRFFLTYLQQQFRQRGEKDVALLRALRRAWWPYKHPFQAKIVSVFQRAARRLRRELTARKLSAQLEK